MITNATMPSRWRKSSYSSNNGGNCVEVATTVTAVPVRDSKTPDLGHLTLNRNTWSALLTSLHTS